MRPILYREQSGQGMYESDQMRIEKHFGRVSKLYIKNSPIFNIDKVTTPILIMHNKADELVPWMQGVEFFTGLRRLQKKAWMLQYDNGGHGVYHDQKEGKDLNYTPYAVF